MAKISTDEDDGLFIQRSEVVKSAIDDIKDQIDDTLLVENITNNSVVYKYYGEPGLEPEKLIVNISDQDVGFSLKLITLALISNKYNTLPKIGILIKSEDSDPINNSDSPIKNGWGDESVLESPVKESSEGQNKEEKEDDFINLDIVGLALVDNSGVLYSDVSDHEYDFTIEISSSYIKNSFQRNGVISLAYEEMKEARKLFMNPKTESFIDPDDDDLHEKFEVSMGTMNSAIALQENRERKKWKRRVRINRRNDASGHRARSLQAKLRWKKFKGRILRGMSKFNKSRAGKLSRFRRGRKLSMLHKLKVIGRKDER